MSDSSVRLNRWLIRFCAVLIVIDLLHIPLGLASIPRYLERMATLTIPVYGTGIGNVLTNTSVLAQAEARGMSLTTFAWYLLGVRLLAAVVFTSVGGLVLWRARTHWFGWFTAHVMLFLNSYAFYQPLQVALLLPASVIDLGSVLWPSLLLYFFLFPNGRVVPRWMRWPIVIYAIAHFSLQLAGGLIQAGYLPAGRFEEMLRAAETGILLIFGLVLGSQIYRYVRVSSNVERAQTRWFILGIAVLAGMPAVGSLVGAGRFFESLEWGTLSLTLAPITLAIAILRYRLWDIDVVIRRTLQYTVVSGLLALVYFGSVVLLQTVFDTVVGESPMLLVLSTLLIAALFNPLRGRVQAIIDRRFFRQKYDAQQILAQFAQTARDETDVDALATAIDRVIRQTLQPETASVWLKPDDFGDELQKTISATPFRNV